MAAKKKTKAAVRKDSIGEQIISAAFEIGSTGSLQVGSTLRLRSVQASSLQVGFDWVCFGGACKVVHFHNTLLYKDLCSFERPGNWVCFA